MLTLSIGRSFGMHGRHRDALKGTERNVRRARTCCGRHKPCASPSLRLQTASFRFRACIRRRYLIRDDRSAITFIMKRPCSYYAFSGCRTTVLARVLSCHGLGSEDRPSRHGDHLYISSRTSLFPLPVRLDRTGLLRFNVPEIQHHADLTISLATITGQTLISRAPPLWQLRYKMLYLVLSC